MFSGKQHPRIVARLLSDNIKTLLILQCCFAQLLQIILHPVRTVGDRVRDARGRNPADNPAEQVIMSSFTRRP